MPTSDITVAALTAIPTLRGNKLAWTYSDPRSGAVPNIALDMVEVHASTTNDRTTAAKVGEGITDFLHTGLVEEQTWYYWIKARNYLGHFGDWHPSGSTAGVTATAIGMSGLAFGLANGKLVASVGSNALTVAIKTAAGNDPSAADPVYLAFPNATLTTGNYQIKAVTAALAITISNGSTLGVANASESFKLYVGEFNDAGTLKLGIINASTVGALFPLGGTGVAPFVGVDNGTGAADSAGVWYTATSLTDKTFRVLGTLDFSAGLAAPGAWATAPDIVRLVGPETRLAGQVVQQVAMIDQSYGGTNTVVIPYDNTIPQITEGKAVFSSFLLTPASAANFFEFEGEISMASSVASELVCALFREAAANAVAASWDYAPTANKPISLRFRFRVKAGSVSARTFDIRAGACQAGTVTYNGAAGAALLGGVLTSFLTITEIAG